MWEEPLPCNLYACFEREAIVQATYMTAELALVSGQPGTRLVLGTRCRAVSASLCLAVRARPIGRSRTLELSRIRCQDSPLCNETCAPVLGCSRYHLASCRCAVAHMTNAVHKRYWHSAALGGAQTGQPAGVTSGPGVAVVDNNKGLHFAAKPINL